MTIIFSAIIVAFVIGAPVSFSWFWPNNNRATPSLSPGATNREGITPAKSNITNGRYIASTKDAFKEIYDSNPPQVADKSLRVEKVISGLDSPVSMEFVGYSSILIVEKNSGAVRFVSNGTLQTRPILQRPVEKDSERGMLGVAVSNTSANDTRPVFLYYTVRDSTSEIVNRISKYQWDGKDNLTREQVILNLPATPGPNHNGGKLAIGPDGMLYAVIGDLNRRGMDQNYKDGPKPDNTSAIFRLDQNGNAVANKTLSASDPATNNTLRRYYAYGIRNSFGLAFDPITGKLWDTENGPNEYDEINIITPGFNSGWEKVMGPIGRTNESPKVLVEFNGSHYNEPVFSWRHPVAPTAIDFFNSIKLGLPYTNNIFVGDFNNGDLYFFTVNKDRNGVLLEDTSFQDRVADNSTESTKVAFATGFTGGITDIKTGSDGYLYILTYAGDLYRIVPVTKP